MSSKAHQIEKSKKKSEDGIKLNNSHLMEMKFDVLYHLALSNEFCDFVEMFGDVKFVCMGGTSKRMESFAYFVMDFIGYKLPIGNTLSDISEKGHRFSMYKVGPVLSVSHGMGNPSLGILLNEILKLLYHAKVKDPIFFRIGTCGGIGTEPGTVIVSNDAIDGLGNNHYEIPILGKSVKRPSVFNRELIEELMACVDTNDDYRTITGTTMCANDFYEGQGRLDGAFCNYGEADKMEFLKQLQKRGVVNIEMEATLLAAFTHHAGIKAADVCVTFLDRLQGDQVETPKDTLEQWQIRPQKLVARFIKKYLENKN